MKISRHWGMPSADTFDCPPIEGFVKKYLMHSKKSVDPFARNKRWATYTNDLNPKTNADSHMDAIDFLKQLADGGKSADLVIIDPPYSPRQTKECYDNIGLKMESNDALLGLFRKKLKEQICRVLVPGGIVLTFGWNSVGMGKSLGFDIVEIVLVCHGSDHNDTLCVAEKKLNPYPTLNLF